MKKLILALFFVSLNANAEAIMWCLNQDGNKIVLTDESCTKSGKIAYILSNTSETIMGCWTNDALAIHVLWSSKYMRSYDYEGWTVVKKESTL